MQEIASPREVRLERWRGRTFFVVPCPFHVDLPLDMSGCLRASLREVQRAGYVAKDGGALLASDVRGAGAVFVEIEPPEETDPRVVSITGEMVVRCLHSEGFDGPPSTYCEARGLRRDVDELVRWSTELGRDIATFFVGFSRGEAGAFRASRILAHLDGELVEHFEVRSTVSYVVKEVRVTLDAAAPA